MNAVQMVYHILQNRKALPSELSGETEFFWQQLLQELVNSKGQEILLLIVRYIKFNEIVQNLTQARWVIFLARTMLGVKEISNDVFACAAVRYLEAGIYFAAHFDEKNRIDDKEEEKFFSQLSEIKQLDLLSESLKAKCCLEKLKSQYPNISKIIEMGEDHGVFCFGKKKIAFFVKPGMDSFLGTIIKSLQDDYIVEKYVITEAGQIDKGMAWADICWFEWCDELVIYGSRLEAAKRKKLICRLHSYEAFTEYPKQVTWNVVDQVIFVAEHIRDFVLENVLVLKQEQTIIIPNGIDLEKYTYKKRMPGFNIAYVGYINYKKGPMLLLHAFKAIYDKDDRYKLYIAGQFQDPRDVLYFRQMIKEWKMEKNVIFQGWQNDLNTWLEDKNYILCTSLLESQNMSVMQAMAKGIKPLIHNFVGASNVYPLELTWNSIEDCVKKIFERPYSSKCYREFIEEKYYLKKQTSKIETMIKTLASNAGSSNDGDYILKKTIDEKNNYLLPLVSIGVTVYNGLPYVVECIESILHQTYSNIEIILIDDCSTDGSIEVLREYQSKYSNVKLILHEENSGGVSKGFQELIENSKGEYFQWIACDDFLEPDAVAQFISFLEKNPQVDYAYSDLTIVDESSKKRDVWGREKPNKIEVIQHVFHTGSGMIPMNCMYRKLFFIKNNITWILYKENDFSSDTLNCIHFIRHGMVYDKIDKSVINYRIHSSNTSHNLKRRIESSSAIFDYIIQNFNESDYFPNINWEKSVNPKQLKNYCIARFYLRLVENHLSGALIPGYLHAADAYEEILQHCACFIKEGMKYLNMGLQQGSEYENELYTIKEKYQEMIGRYQLNGT